MPVPLCQCRLGPCQYNLTCRRIVPKKEVAGWRVPHFFVVVASDKGTMLSTGHRLLLKNPEITHRLSNYHLVYYSHLHPHTPCHLVNLPAKLSLRGVHPSNGSPLGCLTRSPQRQLARVQRYVCANTTSNATHLRGATARNTESDGQKETPQRTLDAHSSHRERPDEPHRYN